MKVIGIVGGMGAGKSTVITIMNEIQPLSCISADLIGHEILLKGAAAYQPIIKAFGEEILDESGEIERQKLGRLVFGNTEKVALLNAITHPIITTKVKERIAYYQKMAPGQHIILEAALLLESGLVDLTDVVIAVYADQDIRLKRVMARERLDEKHILKRFKAQKEWEELKAAADYVIDNGISLDATATQIKQLLTLL